MLASKVSNHISCADDGFPLLACSQWEIENIGTNLFAVDRYFGTQIFSKSSLEGSRPKRVRVVRHIAAIVNLQYCFRDAYYLKSIGNARP